MLKSFCLFLDIFFLKARIFKCQVNKRKTKTLILQHAYQLVSEFSRILQNYKISFSIKHLNYSSLFNFWNFIFYISWLSNAFIDNYNQHLLNVAKPQVSFQVRNLLGGACKAKSNIHSILFNDDFTVKVLDKRERKMRAYLTFLSPSRMCALWIENASDVNRIASFTHMWCLIF